MRDTLFLLTPGFEDKGKPWFCPYSAQVVGMLTYYPQLRDTLDVVEVPFPKPRQAVVELLGDKHQALPMLVLGDDAPTEELANITVGEHDGRRYVSNTIEIMRYLAVTRGVPAPH